MDKKICIIVCGPTAVGKTSYAIDLALQNRTEIISCDSRQCFKELNIGVAKPSVEQLQKVKHYFINSHSIYDHVDVKVFEEYALNTVHHIFKKSDIAVMVGGTGLYIKAFSEGIDEIPEIDKSIRQKINQQYLDNGFGWLYDQMKINDPLFFSDGEMENPQRMLRALEVKIATGKSILDFHSGKKVKRDFEIKNKLLSLPREQLYQNINHRVDEMMNRGLLNEAKDLYSLRQLNALQTVGYKELFDYFDGKKSLNQAVDDIKKNTRHYAKRQITWFKKYLTRDGGHPDN